MQFEISVESDVENEVEMNILKLLCTSKRITDGLCNSQQSNALLKNKQVICMHLCASAMSVLSSVLCL